MRVFVADADAPALNYALAAARPEVVVNQLTALPDRFDFKDPDLYTATNRVRTEGTRNLIAAARAGAGRMVAQSVCFVYAPVGDFQGQGGAGDRERGASVRRGL